MDELIRTAYIRGPLGPRGPQGPVGPKGEQGPIGLKGDKGDMGPMGPRGFQGPQGIQGTQGEKGDKGDQGIQGEKGDPFTYEDFTAAQLEALRGPQGEQGVQGPAGPKGDQGPQGVLGPKGADGIMTFLDLTEEQRESLRGPLGIQGPAGQDGSDGVDGQDGAPGLDGHSPVVTASKSGSTTTIYVDGTSIATIEDGLDGQDGQNGTNGTNGLDGQDGVTPHIDSTTGNWFVGTTDTGVHAQGPAGLDGSDAAIDTNDFLHTPIDHNGHAYVDLGLPSGTLWATMNVGASSETDYGNYYMYGKGSTQFNLSDSKYTGQEDPLDLSVDTARLVWGGSWHMPTYDLIQELITNTTYEWTTINGINGGKFTSTNGNYIFFPASGEIYGPGYSNSGLNPYLGDEGNYWSSTPAPDINSLNTLRAKGFSVSGPNGTFRYTHATTFASSRGNGCTIRAVLGGVLEIASKVAITGSYNDLTDKPTIPTIWNGTQAQYDLLTPDSNTIYIITSAS